ncbi:MAG: TonB-dependent receptor domain-containing protein [Rhodanobacteraceae bacterium]
MAHQVKSANKLGSCRQTTLAAHPLRRNALALALAAAVASTGLGTALAETPANTSPPRAVVRALDYSIAPGNLTHGLAELAQQAKVRVDYRPELVAGRTTQGVTGRYLPERALRVLLRGTGLAPYRVDGTTFVLRLAATRDPEDPPQQTPPPPPPEPTAKPKSKPEKLQTITVTGSLIPQAQIETAVPTIKLYPEQLQRQGFGSVESALRAQPVSTGAVLDNQSTLEFSPGAQTISLLGLDPGFTLILINGHPMTSYPLLYNGQSNFVNLADIPMGMIQRIDIVPGNLSSIYGSSAIAGVVNIILKDHINGYELNVRGGNYTDGGGANERIEFIGGFDKDKLSMVYGFQFNHQNPIFADQRSITASSLSNPDPALRYGYPIFSHQYYSDYGYSVYQDPGDQCKNVKNLYFGTVKREAQPNTGPPFDPSSGAPIGPGYYCGSPYWVGEQTLQNKDRAGSGYLDVKYKLDGNNELYADVLYGVSTNSIFMGPQFWESNLNGDGVFYNQNTGLFETLLRNFAPEEVGSWHNEGEKFFDRRYDAWGGLRGNIDNLNYNFYVARSQESVNESVNWLLTDKVNDFFQKQVLGPSLGTTSGYPIYAPDLKNFYKAVTPSQYAAMNGMQFDHNVTWIQNVNAEVSDSDLFELPGGSAGFAAVFQYGEQVWSNPTDPRVLAGDFYSLTGTSGGGARNNWAFGGEFRAPIFKMLTADLSVRYDQFSNHGGGTSGHATYKLGLEFRPFKTLLIRGTYATAFRAPDMAYVFGGESGFFGGGFTDYYRCDQFGGPVTSCPYYNNQPAFELHYGNRNLKPITAKSYGLGFVWSPTSNFDFKTDYYNISIANEVELQSEDALLRTEAQCRTGRLNIDLPICVQTLSQIERYPVNSPGGDSIEQITVLPINIANEHVFGVMASLDYSHGLGRFGRVKLSASYNVTLKHTFQQNPGDQPVNLLTQPELAPYSTEFKNIANASVTWDIGKWSATLYGTRYGKTPNYAAQFNGYGTDYSGYNGQPAGAVSPWMIYNGSVSYSVTHAMTITGVIHNIKNSMPPSDASNVAWPYYNIDNYNPYGREYWLEFDWRFGQH